MRQNSPTLVFAFLFLLFGCSADVPSQSETPHTVSKAQRVHQWFRLVQLDNGLVPSREGPDNAWAISLYDQALSAMVFLVMDDLPRAERVLDFFNQRVDTELRVGNGGFWMFRPKSGLPTKVAPGKWLGDNAYLLAAIYCYQEKTGDVLRYAWMRDALQSWILALQDSDGGLVSGYTEADVRRTDKITEGNIDAFGAVPGYTSFHSGILSFFRKERWDSQDRMLVAWVGSPQWRYACDNVSWAWCAIESFSTSSLLFAEQAFLVTKVATATPVSTTGFCFDQDRDTIHPEASMSMAVAYHLAGNPAQANSTIVESEKIFLPGLTDPQTGGLPYASNSGTTYGSGMLDPETMDRPWASASAWYIFAKKGFNPFGYARSRGIPLQDQFWNETVGL